MPKRDPWLSQFYDWKNDALVNSLHEGPFTFWVERHKLMINVIHHQLSRRVKKWVTLTDAGAVCVSKMKIESLRNDVEIKWQKYF